MLRHFQTTAARNHLFVRLWLSGSRRLVS